jgi:hypothetical protein
MCGCACQQGERPIAPCCPAAQYVDIVNTDCSLPGSTGAGSFSSAIAFTVAVLNGLDPNAPLWLTETGIEIGQPDGWEVPPLALSSLARFGALGPAVRGVRRCRRGRPYCSSERTRQ